MVENLDSDLVHERIPVSVCLRRVCTVHYPHRNPLCKQFIRESFLCGFSPLTITNQPPIIITPKRPPKVKTKPWKWNGRSRRLRWWWWWSKLVLSSCMDSIVDSVHHNGGGGWKGKHNSILSIGENVIFNVCIWPTETERASECCCGKSEWVSVRYAFTCLTD